METKPAELKSEIESVIEAIMKDNLQALETFRDNGFPFARINLIYDPFSGVITSRSGWVDEKKLRYESEDYKDNPKEQNLLLYAVISNKPESIDFILRNKLVDVDIVDKDRVSALNLAIHKGYVDLAKKLVLHGADLTLEYVEIKLDSTSTGGYEFYHGCTEVTESTTYFTVYKASEYTLSSKFIELMAKEGVLPGEIQKFIETNLSLRDIQRLEANRAAERPIDKVDSNKPPIGQVL